MTDQNELDPNLVKPEATAPEATPTTTEQEVQEERPAAIFTASGNVADTIHAELKEQQAIIQDSINDMIFRLELTSDYNKYLKNGNKNNTPLERTNFLFEYVPTQPETKTKTKQKIAYFSDRLHTLSHEQYSSIHNDPKFKNDIHTIQWGANNQESQSFSIGSQTIESVNDKADKMPFRNIDIPATISPDEAPLYLAFVARDSTNQNMKNPAFYFSINYNSEGKVAGMMYPTPIKFSKNEPHIAYVEDKGQKYTLPITNKQFDAIQQSLNQDQSRGQDQIIKPDQSRGQDKIIKKDNKIAQEQSQNTGQQLHESAEIPPVPPLLDGDTQLKQYHTSPTLPSADSTSNLVGTENSNLQPLPSPPPASTSERLTQASEKTKALATTSKNPASNKGQKSVHTRRNKKGHSR